jgi:2,5-diketo-D-gluconate reductase A
VVLRWHVQCGNIVIPKSGTPARIKENFEIFDFELSTADVEAIDGLDRAARTGADPATFVG